MVKWDVLGFGVVAVDDLWYVDGYPQAGSKTQVYTKQRQGGGLTGTALVAASRLGARAAYCGVLGDDDLSRFTIQELEREAVDCTPVLRRTGARPYHSLVIVDQSSGERTIIFTAEGVVERQPGEMTHDLIGACRVLFVDYFGVEGGLRAVALAHAQGIPVVGDIERIPQPGVEELLHQIDHLIVGVELAAVVAGETEPERMVRALSGPERACCVVTAGDQGCWYSERGGEVHHVPAYQVQVVDTTGCGDVFHGAYAACIAQDEGVARAVQVAAATAGLKTTQPGGRAGIPSRDTVERFIKENQSGA